LPSTRKPQSRLDNEPLARSWVWDKEMEIIIWVHQPPVDVAFQISIPRVEGEERSPEPVDMEREERETGWAW
jgi:hypothetical protein